MSAWLEYTRNVLEGGAVRAAHQNWNYHSPSLGYLLEFRPPPARVLSIGCNLGLFDALLQAHGYEVTSIDNDPAILEAATELSKRLGFGLRFEQADAFNLEGYHGRFDVAYSAGLVEHWHGRETVRLLKEHARCAPLVQAEVPTRWTWRLNTGAVAEDMRTFRAREFAAQFRKAGLRPQKVYPLGGVPSRAREISEALLPPALFHRIQLLTGLSMGVGVIAFR